MQQPARVRTDAHNGYFRRSLQLRTRRSDRGASNPSQGKGIPFHVPVHPPEGGVTKISFIKCEDVRSISKDRLIRRFGSVAGNTIDAVEDRLRILLDL